MQKKTTLVDQTNALPGRDEVMNVSEKHSVLETKMKGPFQSNHKTIILGMGCFWGAERLFWQCDGVVTTAVGYAGGFTPNPTYEEVCGGLTGHTEVVMIVYDPLKISLNDLLVIFWQSHNPSQGMRQGNDIGTQYRSAIYVDNEDDYQVVATSKMKYEQKLAKNGHPSITTEIKILDKLYFAEDYHQQYLFKNPNGYCGLSGTGVDY